jgi:hypothetical protein
MVVSRAALPDVPGVYFTSWFRDFGNVGLA